jgi:homogentisate phytyltransferase / homogentisate geranylgeranyltransferase
MCLPQMTDRHTGILVRLIKVSVFLVFALLHRSVQCFQTSVYSRYVSPTRFLRQHIVTDQTKTIFLAVVALTPSDSGRNTNSDTVTVVSPEPVINGSNEGTVAGVSFQPTDDLLNAKTSVPFPIVLWRFTRPHTLIGSALAIPALHLLAAPTLNDVFTVRCLISILYAMVPSLLMNLYITGLNQITDVEIDKINKPDLPMAAGILSKRDAIVTCAIALIISLYIGTFAHPIYSTRGLQVALWGSGILGTLYSLEPVRLKRRHPFLAAFCIVAVRGMIINAGFFAHATAAVFGRPSATVVSCLLTDTRCLFSSIFFGIFGIVIALMKDVPDVLGDKVSNVRTFSVRVGPERIFHASRRLLTGLFCVVGAGFLQLAITAASPRLAVYRYVVAICSAAAAFSVRQQSSKVDPKSPTQVYKYYMHLWKIFYLSYLVLPLGR